MNTCYVLTILSFLLLLLTALQGYFSFLIFNANHPTFALLTVIVYLFTETLIIFFFVGIGVSIKEYIQAHKANPDFHKRSLAIKRRVYPPLLLNIVLIMTLFITGGAVDTGHMPGWLHGTLFCISILHFLKAITVQHHSFRESTAIVLEMAGVQRPEGIF